MHAVRPPQAAARPDESGHYEPSRDRRAGFILLDFKYISAMLRSHQTEIRVRYSETDAQGVLHHANYVNYYEVGRVELLRAQGGDYREIEEQGYFLVVVEFHCKYIAPAHYDDLLTVTTSVSRVTPARLEHEYEVHRGEQLLATAHSVLACIDRAGRVQRIPNVIPGLEVD